jgi:hypothetical protein
MRISDFILAIIIISLALFHSHYHINGQCVFNMFKSIVHQGARNAANDGFDGHGGRQRQIFILNLEVEEPAWQGPGHPLNQWIMKFDAREVRGESGERSA